MLRPPTRRPKRKKHNVLLRWENVSYRVGQGAPWVTRPMEIDLNASVRIISCTSLLRVVRILLVESSRRIVPHLEMTFRATVGRLRSR